jgi:salicylate hydroxylase
MQHCSCANFGSANRIGVNPQKLALTSGHKKGHKKGEIRVGRALRVAVIGAGIGGLAAAGALRKLGCEVQVFERSGSLGEVGAGLQIGPNGVKVLRALGLDDTLNGLAFEPTQIVSLAWDDAHLRYREPLKGEAERKFGAPYITAHRADLHRLLQEKLPERAIHVNARCTSVQSPPAQAVASFADGSQVEADIIVGADGIRSTVRETMFGAAPARYTEQMGWRGIVSIDDVPTAVGPGRSVSIDRSEYIGWIGPTGHVICYPIRGGTLYNLFVGHVSPEWVEESWTVPSTKEEMFVAFAGWNDALLGMLDKIEHVFKWGIYDREPLTQWTQGRLTLLGDAAHPMMPTLAQGASITLEDAYTLARNVARFANEPLLGLKAYEAERLGRARAVQLQAREQFQNNRKNPAPPPLSRDWIFQHDATVAPQVAAE